MRHDTNTFFFPFLNSLNNKAPKSGILQVIVLMLGLQKKAPKGSWLFFWVDVKHCLSQAAWRTVEDKKIIIKPFKRYCRVSDTEHCTHIWMLPQQVCVTLSAVCWPPSRAFSWTSESGPATSLSLASTFDLLPSTAESPSASVSFRRLGDS